MRRFLLSIFQDGNSLIVREFYERILTMEGLK